MDSSISLLTCDGTVEMTFSPALSVNQYARLLDIANRADDAEQLKEAVTLWADFEGLQYSFDEVPSADLE